MVACFKIRPYRIVRLRVTACIRIDFQLAHRIPLGHYVMTAKINGLLVSMVMSIILITTKQIKTDARAKREFLNAFISPLLH
jgi:hypothetical protein